MKSRMMIGFLVIAIAAAAIGGATMAFWTSEGDAGGPAQFHAGILKIDVSDGLIDVTTTLPFEYGNMNPGDIFDEFVIVIENKGTKNLIWFGNWSAFLKEDDKTAALLDGIYVHMAKMEFLDADGKNYPYDSGSWEEPVDQFVTDGVGSGLYPNWYNTLAAEPPFPVISLRSWLDNNGMGTTPYEHVGALKPGYAYRLTVQLGFYEGVDNDYQGDVASAIGLNFNVKSTQVLAAAIDEIVTTGGGGAHWENWALGQIANQN